jgi:hypothetical protein
VGVFLTVRADPPDARRKGQPLACAEDWPAFADTLRVVREGATGWPAEFVVFRPVGNQAPVCTENPIRIDWGGNHLTSAHNDRAAIFCP